MPLRPLLVGVFLKVGIGRIMPLLGKGLNGSNVSMKVSNATEFEGRIGSQIGVKFKRHVNFEVMGGTETKVSKEHALLKLSNAHFIMPLMPFLIGLLTKVRFWPIMRLCGGRSSGQDVHVKVSNATTVEGKFGPKIGFKYEKRTSWEFLRGTGIEGVGNDTADMRVD